MKKSVLKHLILISVVLVTIMALAACAPATPTQPGGTSGGGAATEAAGGTTGGGAAATQAPLPEGTTQPMEAITKEVNLDPAQAEDNDSKTVAGYLYEPLTGVDKGQAVPWLATAVTIAEDGLAYTFELRSDTKFSDGSPLNAEAVVANFNRWFDPADAMHGAGTYKAWSDLFGGFKGETGGDGKPKSAFDGIEKTGDFTVVVHLNRAVPNLETKLSGLAFSMIKMGADGKSYLGTGAYMVGEKSDTHLLLVPNPNYTGPFKSNDKLDFPFK